MHSNKVLFPDPFSPIITLIPFTIGISILFIEILEITLLSFLLQLNLEVGDVTAINNPLKVGNILASEK